jgi:predicted signal transduction protein with EAL and GGDEF domain
MSSKRLSLFDLSATALREITDALVMLSMAIISYVGMTYWGGVSVLSTIIGTQLETPSFAYFFGIALVAFSVRRISDQRHERIRREAAEQNAHILSMRDPLTQLPNRRKFEIDVRTALDAPSSKLTVLLLGLEEFKKLHDVYGHLGCDAVLSQVAARLQDRVGPAKALARMRVVTQPIGRMTFRCRSTSGTVRRPSCTGSRRAAR